MNSFGRVITYIYIYVCVYSNLRLCSLVLLFIHHDVYLLYLLGYKLRTLNRYYFTALKTVVMYNILFDDDIRIFYFECFYKNTTCKPKDIDILYRYVFIICIYLLNTCRISTL